MTFDEWYENLTADCPTWRDSFVMETARVVWMAAVAAERERWIEAVEGNFAGSSYGLSPRIAALLVERVCGPNVGGNPQ